MLVTSHLYLLAILGKIIKGSPNGLFHIWYQEIRQDFEKWFSVSRKGVKNEVFPIKILAFKIFIFSVFQNHHFCKILKKIMFYHFH